jgi:hypothetical protein
MAAGLIGFCRRLWHLHEAEIADCVSFGKSSFAVPLRPHSDH